MEEIWEMLNVLDESEVIEEGISTNEIKAAYDKYAETMEALKDK